ncbi:hypothetical protein Tco_1550400, partial [Tanacetum coccineum]
GRKVTEARNMQPVDVFIKKTAKSASETRTQSSDAISTTTANEVLGMDVNVSNKGSWNLPIQISIWSSTQQLGI